jgi:hypothetical protein
MPSTMGTEFWQPPSTWVLYPSPGPPNPLYLYWLRPHLSAVAVRCVVSAQLSPSKLAIDGSADGDLRPYGGHSALAVLI